MTNATTEEGMLAHRIASKIMAPRITLATRIRVVMQYSVPKSYQSFSVYFDKADLGEKCACVILESVDCFTNRRDA